MNLMNNEIFILKLFKYLKFLKLGNSKNCNTYLKLYI